MTTLDDLLQQAGAELDRLSLEWQPAPRNEDRNDPPRSRQVQLTVGAAAVAAGLVIGLVVVSGGRDATAPVDSPASTETTPPTTAPTEDPWETLARYDLNAAVGYTPNERATIKRAWELEYSACAADAGYNLVPRAYRPDDGWARQQLDVLRFDNIARLSTEGYHIYNTPSPRGLEPAPTINDDTLRLPDAVENSCKTAANDAFGGIPGIADEDIAVANGDIISRVSTAPELADTRSRWSDCMAAAGYPGLDLSSGRWTYEFVTAPEVTGTETATALADSQCRISTGYRDERLTLLAEQVSAWLADNAGLVAGISEQIDHEKQRANEILRAAEPATTATPPTAAPPVSVAADAAVDPTLRAAFASLIPAGFQLVHVGNHFGPYVAAYDSDGVRLEISVQDSTDSVRTDDPGWVQVSEGLLHGASRDTQASLVTNDGQFITVLRLAADGRSADAIVASVTQPPASGWWTCCSTSPNAPVLRILRVAAISAPTMPTSASPSTVPRWGSS